MGRDTFAAVVRRLLRRSSLHAASTSVCAFDFLRQWRDSEVRAAHAPAVLLQRTSPNIRGDDLGICSIAIVIVLSELCARWRASSPCVVFSAAITCVSLYKTNSLSKIRTCVDVCIRARIYAFAYPQVNVLVCCS